MAEGKTENILQMEDITVRFPGVLALNKARFDLNRGEVHALLGENGAGKSTIMKVLAGVNTDYSGTVRLKGEDIICSSINEQRSRGVSIIFQEMNLLNNLTVAENIFLGRQPLTKTGKIDWTLMNQQARELLDSINSSISEKKLVGELSVGQMQMVEIAKALSFESEIIIMDEPTSSLTEKEVDALFNIMDKLKSKGVAIVYISHRLEEIMKKADRVTIFRDGEFIKTMNISDTNIDEMVSLMVGREMDDYYPRIDTSPGEVFLEAKNINDGEILNDVSFYARAGEITGFYGLMGAGRTELMSAIFGASKITSGQIFIKGKEVQIKSCEDAKNNGIAFLPEDRKHQGLILNFDLNSNISLTNLSKIMGKFGLENKKEIENNKKLTDSVKVKTPSLYQLAKNLSGGNQQKVVICKWLNTNSEIVIFDEPTRGIDVGSKVEIYKIMNSLKEEGKAVIVVSSELQECIGISDRIYVMHEGKITTCIEEDIVNLTEDEVIKYATGAKTMYQEAKSNEN